ncbi:hypothetical protein [Gorillibacterium sp. sgz5001074]|uniref:hypothetical protein n=1 Tax=Gorillibacterium sp. sgz5001074 TaxID=3446695 RepID=UPI003F6650E5
MDRRQFMKELGTGLFKTVREVAGPFVERDLEKLSRLRDHWSGYVFVPLELPAASNQDQVLDRWANGETLLVRSSDEGWAAYSGRCPDCGQLLHYLAYSDTASCFGCGSSYGWEEQDRSPVRYPLRREGGGWRVGLPPKEKAHA